jgi:PDZ domain
VPLILSFTLRQRSTSRAHSLCDLRSSCTASKAFHVLILRPAFVPFPDPAFCFLLLFLLLYLYLQSFFVEDPLLEQRRAVLESRRDRLVLASSALSRIQIRVQTQPSHAQTRSFGGISTAQGGTGRGETSPLNINGNVNSNGNIVLKSRLLVTVAIGASGIGLIVTDEETANGIVIIVKDLRKMPGGIMNPSEYAGILVGDEVEKINGETPATLKDAVNMLKNSQQSVNLTVLRKQ